jgi:hypothetical protein
VILGSRDLVASADVMIERDLGIARSRRLGRCDDREFPAWGHGAAWSWPSCDDRTPRPARNAGRVLQALSACAGIVLSRAMIRDVYEREAAAATLG